MSPLHGRDSSLVADSALNPASLDGAESNITTIVFGILALVVGIATIWQSYRTYKAWHSATTGVEIEASRVEEPDNRAERPNKHSKSLQPVTSKGM